MAPYRNFLVLRHDGKVIPYGGTGLPRNGGSANHGFRNLKANPALVHSIPELNNDGAMRLLVTSINGAGTGLFSVGCESGPVVESQGHRYTGYIEFTLNSRLQVEDATNFFPLFFHFDQLLFNSHFAHPVNFEWELQPAYFADAKVNGFTCSVIVNTHFLATSEEAQGCWVAALTVLRQFLSSVPPQPGEQLIALEA